MKPIVHHKTFEKHFQMRIKGNKKLEQKTLESITLFLKDRNHKDLKDHPLQGKLYPKRAFSVGWDIRIIYIESSEYYEFLDIGSHNQVYK